MKHCINSAENSGNFKNKHLCNFALTYRDEVVTVRYVTTDGGLASCICNNKVKEQQLLLASISFV